MDTDTLSTLFALLALACLAGSALLGVSWLLARYAARPWWLERLHDDVARSALWLAWLVATVATAGSLYYSEVAGFIPCPLCWYQRIAMYPLVVLLGVAALRRDAGVRWYAGPLAAIGALVAAYHVWVQTAQQASTPFCSLTAPCDVRHVWELGFVSLPFMALSGFVFVLAMLAVTSSAAVPSTEPLAETRPTRPTASTVSSSSEIP